MSRYEYGKALNILKMNEPMKGAAVTEPFNDRSVIYSLGKDTDIEAESFHQYHFLFVAKGKIECYALNEGGIQKRWNVREGGMTMLPLDMPVGVNALEDSVYMRISAVRKEDIDPDLEMEKEYLIQDLTRFIEHSTSVVPIIFNEQMRVSLLSMDTNAVYQKTPGGNTAFTIMEGSVDVTYEGVVTTVHEGEVFVVEKGKNIELHASREPARINVIENAL